MKYEEIISLIKSEIAKQNLTQRIVASGAFINEKTLNNYLKDARKMPLDIAIDVLKVLGISLQSASIKKDAC